MKAQNNVFFFFENSNSFSGYWNNVRSIIFPSISFHQFTIQQVTLHLPNIEFKRKRIFPGLMSTRSFFLYTTLKNTIRVYTFRYIHQTTTSLAHLHSEIPMEHTVRLVYKCTDKHLILSLVSRYS